MLQAADPASLTPLKKRASARDARFIRPLCTAGELVGMEFRFREKGKELFINGNRVIRTWESWSGWYWFAFEEADRQDSVIDGHVVKNDTIYFGLVQGFEEELGYFSLAELESMKPRVWEIPKHATHYSGRRR